MSESTVLYSEYRCVICHEDLDKSSAAVQTLTERGLATLQECSSDRGDKDLCSFLFSRPTEVKVHLECRKAYTRRSKRKSNELSMDENCKQSRLGTANTSQVLGVHG